MLLYKEHTTMMINHTKAVFDATASTYDADRSRLIPGCDNFYRWAIDLIPPRARTICTLIRSPLGKGVLTSPSSQTMSTTHPSVEPHCAVVPVQATVLVVPESAVISSGLKVLRSEPG